MNCVPYSPVFPCDFDPQSVTPPPDGTTTSEVTINIEPWRNPDTYQEEILATWNSAARIFPVTVQVEGDDHIFSDDFESGSTSARNREVGEPGPTYC